VRAVVSAAAACALCLAAAPAEGACSLSATGVAFGAYDVFAPAPTDSTGTVVLDCDPNEKDITITLSPGTGTYASRTLRQGAETLGYNLYLDAARTTVWGDGSAGTSTVFIKNPRPNRPTEVTIFGRIPAAQDVSVGAYADTIIVTVEF
jgi:spore coat protein U-like protein